MCYKDDYEQEADYMSQEFDGGKLTFTSDEVEALSEADIYTVEELEQKNYSELCDIVGTSSAKAIKKQMNEKGFFLKNSYGADDKRSKLHLQKKKVA